MQDKFTDLLKAFENKRPEIVFEWNDHETDAQGWVVINSLRGGAAGGGTRMRVGLDKHEVISLAKTMEIKFTVSGPPIGGAKSGINFDPTHPDKKGVLSRWFAAVKPILKYYYGTGGDLNVDEKLETIPITEDVGIWHPQEGVFKGHYKPTEAHLVNRIGQLRQGVVKIIEDEAFSPDINKRITVADMITGYGVAEAVRHYYNIWGGDFQGKRAVIQGWGNVGAAAGYYLAQEGVKIVGIVDKGGGVLNQEGFSFEEVRRFYLDKNGTELIADNKLTAEQVRSGLKELKSEVFIPAAASRLITRENVDDMIGSGLEVISCGANVPFADSEIFFGPIGMYTDQKVSVIPDFIANCGMARVFAFLMEDERKLTDEAIFSDVSEIIKKAMEKTQSVNPKPTGLAIASFETALRELV